MSATPRQVGKSLARLIATIRKQPPHKAKPLPKWRNRAAAFAEWENVKNQAP